MSGIDAGHFVWELGGGRSLCLAQPRVMAILNVTPDSFSDGGELGSVEEAVEYGLACLNREGADLLDIGGESTRPGAVRIPAGEQIARIKPVIRGILGEGPDAIISVDTTLCAVAEEALKAGALVINDVSAGRESGAEIFDLIAERGAGLILMHRLRPPGSDAYSDAYVPSAEPDYTGDEGGGVVEVVREFLRERAGAAERAGVRRNRLVLDPGLGFGKTVAQNFELIGAAGELQSELGFPLLSAASRKSFIGAVTGVDDPQERDAGSVAVSMLQYLAGIRLFRVHDCASHQNALSVLAAAEVH